MQFDLKLSNGVSEEGVFRLWIFCANFLTNSLFKKHFDQIEKISVPFLIETVFTNSKRYFV